jgi:hypothetical protein
MSALLTYGHVEKYLRLLFITTFPFSVSLRELILEEYPGVTPRVCKVDFREYGGRCKAISTSKNPNHYRNYLKGFVDLLVSYSPSVSVADLAKYYDGWVIISTAGGRGIHLVTGGRRHAVPNMDTFDQLGLKQNEIIYVSDFVFQTLPVGDPLLPMKT